MEQRRSGKIWMRCNSMQARLFQLAGTQNPGRQVPTVQGCHVLWRYLLSVETFVGIPGGCWFARCVSFGIDDGHFGRKASGVGRLADEVIVIKTKDHIGVPRFQAENRCTPGSCVVFSPPFLATGDPDVKILLVVVNSV